MRRLFWITLGATLGVLIFRRLSQAAQKLTPQGVASSIGEGLSELGASLRDFSDDVRSAMSAHESELRAAAGLDAPAAALGKVPPARSNANGNANGNGTANGLSGTAV